MNTRRNFLKTGTLAALSMPLISCEPGQKYCLEDIPSMTSNPEEYWKVVRKQFPLIDGQTYFNNGTVGPPSGYTLKAVTSHMEHYAMHGAEIDYKNGSGPELLGGYFPYQELREKLGGIINADFKEIAITPNATFGMNYVGQGLDLKEGDELINTDQEHGGGFGVWQLLAKRRGCIYKQAKMPVPANDPQEIVDAIFAQVTEKTKVIAIPHIVSVYGVVMPVKEICSEARNRGIFTILDGAHCVGQIKVDVKDIGCDAYYSSLHKWLLAPAGSGILYINKDKIADIWCTIASYNWDNQDDHGFRLMQNGTTNPSIVSGFNAAIEFYHTIGEDRWIGRIKELGDYLRAGLADLANVKIHSSTHPDMCAGITTYVVEGFTGPELQKVMWEREKLQPRSVGTELLRHSVHIYNSKDEIDRALKVVEGLMS